MRPLIIAEAANPEWSSVPLVGWSQAEALLRQTDGHLVTQIRNAEAIRRTGLDPERVTFIDSERIAAPAYRLAERLAGGDGKAWTVITAIQSLSYPYFEWLVERRFGPRMAQGAFDLVHRVTPLSPTAPSRLAKRCHQLGLPFVLGPLNGGTPWPKEYPELIAQEREWLTRVRRLYEWLPSARSTRAHATAVILASRAAFERESPAFADRYFYMPENGIDLSRFPLAEPRSSRLPLRFVFVGRLVPYKGLDIALEALKPALRAGEASFEVVGDGPERSRVEARAAELDLGSQVRFHGWVAHREVSKLVGQADVFLFPSLREFGGGVVLEAMAVGAVPMIVDYGGPGELVDASTGVKVPMQPRASLIDALQREIGRLLDTPERLEAMRIEGVERIRNLHAWDKKAERIVELYRWVLGNGPKPSWTRPPVAPPSGVQGEDDSTSTPFRA
ncbi:MAG: glycosyltransferase family 4 protein [Myxococcota bacterium]